MKIGIDARNLVPSLSGIGRYVLETSRALGEQGHSVILYLPETQHTPLPDLPGCEVRVANFRGPWRRMIWSATTLPRAASRDAVDVFWGPAHRLPRGLDPSVPKIVTIHDLVWRKAPETMRWQTWLGERLLMRPALAAADYIVADSQATARDVVEFYPSARQRIQCIYPGLTRLEHEDTERPDDPDCVPDKPYALFVGTLEPRKNLARIIEAFASLPPAVRTNLKLVIAGGQGWRMQDLTLLIDKHGLADRIVVAGRVSDDQLSRLYASAKFLLMPSLYEGFGFPIIEAHGFGIPVITSNTSSMPEVAAGGAILVDPCSVAEITGAMLELSSNQHLRERLALEARSNAGRFSWSSTARQLVAVFESTLERKRGPR